jgi:hypothetical protein
MTYKSGRYEAFIARLMNNNRGTAGSAHNKDIITINMLDLGECAKPEDFECWRYRGSYEAILSSQG